MLANNQMCRQCTPRLAISTEMSRTRYLAEGMQAAACISRVARDHQLLTSKGLLKGRGGILTLLPPSYFSVVGIPSHINVFLVDKEYILHCHLPEYRRTCEKKKLNRSLGRGAGSSHRSAMRFGWDAIIYVRHIWMCRTHVQSTH